MSKTTNEILYDKALQAAKALFEDMSVDSEQTIDNLGALSDEIQDLITALESEL